MLCCPQRKEKEMTLLEVCCYSMACAQEAQRCGADRIELCAAPHEGGLTPSLGVLKTVRETVTIPVHPIIRPRGGDFCYTESEFAAMLDDVATVRELGFPGVVIGVLDVDGQVDSARMQKSWRRPVRWRSRSIGLLICVRIRIRLIARWPIPASPVS
jgi:copper homeostasis protein CutC